MYKVAIGIDLDWPYDHHYDVIRGILDYGEKNNIEFSTESWLELSELLDEILENYDGIIARVTSTLGKYCKENNIPLINVWHNSPEKETPLVILDNESIGKQMVRYFVSRGFQNIAFLRRSGDIRAIIMSESFQEEALKQNLDIQENSVLDVIFPSFKDEWLIFNKTVSQWLDNQTFPLAVCVSDHLFARYFIELCKKKNVMIPDDVAVLSGSGDELICNRLKPSISYIENDFIRVGYEAAKSLHKLLKNEKIPHSLRVPAGTLIEKRSTDVEPVEDRVVAKALRFIKDNISSPIQVIDVASSLDIARRTLERRFRKYLNRSINDEILRSKIDCAKKLFLNTDKTIVEVAELTGFTSSQRLSQVFRKHLNLTVKEFRLSEKVNDQSRK